MNFEGDREVTRLLKTMHEGDRGTAENLLPPVCAELHRLARAYIRRFWEGYAGGRADGDLLGGAGVAGRMRGGDVDRGSGAGNGFLAAEGAFDFAYLRTDREPRLRGLPTQGILTDPMIAETSGP